MRILYFSILKRKSAEGRKYLPQRVFIPVRFGGTSGKLHRNISRRSDRLRAPHARFCPEQDLLNTAE